jgi:hypothetical protein
MIAKIGMSLYGLVMFLSMVRAVGQIRKNFDCDLIDAHYAYLDGFAAVRLGRFFGRPVIVTAQGTDVISSDKIGLLTQRDERTIAATIQTH